eukprot:126401_1
MAGLILVGVPVVIGPLFGTFYGTACRMNDFNPGKVYSSCMIGIGLSVATIMMFPPGGANDGKNWGKWLLCSTTTVGFFCAMIVYTIGNQKAYKLIANMLQFS